MRILVIGLGSMGKRRIRNLSVLGHSTIAGFDIRSDRRLEAAKKYNQSSFGDEAKEIAAIFEATPAYLMQKHLSSNSLSFPIVNRDESEIRISELKKKPISTNPSLQNPKFYTPV